MSEGQLVMLIREKVAAIGSLREAARQWKISPTYLCFVMSGKTRPGVSILKAIGYERAPATYRPITGECQSCGWPNNADGTCSRPGCCDSD